MLALIDGDICLYRVGYTTQEETETIAKYRIDELITRILDSVQATSYNVYLSCSRADSFRAKLNPEYKAHRTQEKPKHYEVLKNHLLEHWNAEVAIEEEADDLIGIEQTANLETAIACTYDKDIKYGFEGYKYDFVKEEKFYTTKEEGILFLYKQLLMGDKSDNIFGIKGIGPKTADKILNDYLGYPEEEIFEKVIEVYQEYFPELSREKLIRLLDLSGKQLKIRTYKGEIWQIPIGQRDALNPLLQVA
jgi:DNA polymerase I